ncbi:MAG: hypothetical protein ACTSSJ_05745 [Candidatus Odinarchaeia archaeon]
MRYKSVKQIKLELKRLRSRQNPHVFDSKINERIKKLKLMLKKIRAREQLRE